MSTLLAFPGQGAQQAGMLHALPQHPLVQACLDEASAVLGQSVLELDTAQALSDTRAVQLCLLVAGVACARLLLSDGPTPDYVAGLSIGAYPAAVVAGALGFDDAVRLVALRGQLMQAAYPQGYGMTAIVGLDLGRVEQLLAEAEGPVYLANINADNQVVIAGSHAAMAAVAKRARSEGAGLAKPLAVSVPSHCPLLQVPAEQLAEAFASVSLQPPKVCYLSSTTARPVMEVDKLRDDLAFNMCRIVDWRALASTAFERGVRLQIEMPPGSVLTGLGRRAFPEGTLIAWQGARLDTLHTLMQEQAHARP
ncbi:malonate decarboxylase subunit epsilon [Pseudomonas sp. TE3610]